MGCCWFCCVCCVGYRREIFQIIGTCKCSTLDGVRSFGFFVFLFLVFGYFRFACHRFGFLFFVVLWLVGWFCFFLCWRRCNIFQVIARTGKFSAGNLWCLLFLLWRRRSRRWFWCGIRRTHGLQIISSRESLALWRCPTSSGFLCCVNLFRFFRRLLETLKIGIVSRQLLLAASLAYLQDYDFLGSINAIQKHRIPVGELGLIEGSGSMKIINARKIECFLKVPSNRMNQ